MEMNHAMHAANDDEHANHAGKRWLKYLAIGTALTAGAVILSPYVLPALGIGSSDTADMATDAMHGGNSGLAGGISSLLNLVPVIGSSLAEGGITSAVTSGAIGIGGVLLGRYVGKKEDRTHFIRWSSVITTAALATSALIAMPPLLTGISVGIVFLSEVLSGVHLAGIVAGFMAKTLGGVAHAHAGAGAAGIAATGITHLLTCGMAVLPASVAWFMGGQRPADKKGSTAESSMPAQSSSDNIQPSGMGIHARIETDKPAALGVPCAARLRLTHAESGAPVTAEELAVAHEAKIHLFVTDSSLKDYHHIHPARTNEPGVYAFTFTPRTANNYTAWTDIKLQQDGKNHLIKEVIPSVTGRNIPPTIRQTTQGQADGMTFNWKYSDALQRGSPSIVEIAVTDSQGHPVTNLEPVMGAFAHLVGFSADGKSFIHTHPLSEPLNSDDHGGPRLRFHVEPNASGPVQFYLHIKHGGEYVYVPFGQQIAPPEHAANRVLYHRQAMPMHMAM